MENNDLRQEQSNLQKETKPTCNTIEILTTVCTYIETSQSARNPKY
jgi:hypothetical protein